MQRLMMTNSQSVTTLDLHGYRLEEAISEVTTFLDRIRRTVAGSSGGLGETSIVLVTIITGSGSVRLQSLLHALFGEILR